MFRESLRREDVSEKRSCEEDLMVFHHRQENAYPDFGENGVCTLVVSCPPPIVPLAGSIS